MEDLITVNELAQMLLYSDLTAKELLNIEGTKPVEINGIQYWNRQAVEQAIQNAAKPHAQ